MTELQAWIVIVLLAVIAGALYPLGRQIERFINVVIHQRELLQQRHPDDDAIRLYLYNLLAAAADGRIESLRATPTGTQVIVEELKASRQRRSAATSAE